MEELDLNDKAIETLIANTDACLVVFQENEDVVCVLPEDHGDSLMLHGFAALKIDEQEIEQNPE